MARTGKKSDLTGRRYGMLTVSGPTGQRENGYIVWLCRCECGGEILLDTRCLQRGTVTDCGYITKVKPGQRDVSGRRFGQLTALEPTGETVRGSAVRCCRYDCGGEIHASLHQLTADCRKSCNCLGHPARKAFIGKRFGRLVVTAYAKKQNGMHRWRCRCDCGKETVVGSPCSRRGGRRAAAASKRRSTRTIYSSSMVPWCPCSRSSWTD